MSFKIVLVVLFQLSAFFVPQLWSQTFPVAGDDSDSPSREGRTFGFWNHGHGGFDGPPFPFRALDQEASFSGINTFNSEPFPGQKDNDLLFGKEVVQSAPNLIDHYTGQRQFPFFQFPFPNFPLQQPPQQHHQQPPFFNFPQFKPWWQGDNVCVVKHESTDEWAGNEVGIADQPDFSINIQSCIEEHGKYICRTITNRGGKKLTSIETRECCRGYARFPQRQGPNAACVKVDTVSFKEAANRYGYPDFSSTLRKANISQETIQNATLLLPLNKHKSDNEDSNDTLANGTEENSTFFEDIKEYIIPNRTLDLEAIENESVFKTEKNHVIRINVYPRTDANASDYEYLYHYTANCVPVLKPKIFASEGMVLGLEKELKVAEQSLMGVIRDHEDLQMFTKIIESFNLTEMLEKKEGLTVLAPQDKAFANLGPVERKMLTTGDECASEYVSNHLLGLTFCSSAVVKNAKAYVNNLLHNQLAFEREAGSGEIVINQVSKATELDLIGLNGVVHIVDKVLPSDASMTVSSLLQKKNSTIFAKLLLSSEYAEELENLRGVTMFVPTDKALENSIWKAELERDSKALVRNHTLYKFLTNHIVDGIIGSHEFRTNYLKSMAKQDLKMNSILNHPSSGATLNCARFISTDGVSCNRAIHNIDRALDLPTMTLLRALQTNKDYSKFLKLLKRSNLTHLVDDNARDLTVLVPTNAVFEEQSDFYQDLMESNLESFVKNHLIKNSICCSAFPKYPSINTVESLTGSSLLVTKNRRPMIANAHIAKCDIILENGIIFEINDIIEARAPTQRNPFF